MSPRAKSDPLDLRVEQHLLANGLRVLICPSAAAPVVSVQTWFRVGSRHEREGLTGIAHLFEHLMFNRTERLAAGEFDRLMEQAGGDTNASTWTDWTQYTDNLPADRLELALRLEAERMQRLVLDDEVVESEREVVMNERRFRVEDDVEGAISEELYARAFTQHPYRWPTIGWMRDIRAITIADARAFYRTHYAPNNATLVIAGACEPAAVLREIERRYGRIRPQVLPTETIVVEPEQTEERRATLVRPVAAARACYAWKAPAQGDPDWSALALAHTVLLGGAAARLYRRLVVDDELASQVGGMLTPFAHPGLYELFVSLVRGHTVAEVEQVIDEEVARLSAAAPSAAELTRARTRLETEFCVELETADGKAQALGHYDATLGDHRLLREQHARLLAVRPEEISRAAARYLRKERRTVVVAEPSGEVVDDEGDDA